MKNLIPIALAIFLALSFQARADDDATEMNPEDRLKGMDEIYLIISQCAARHLSFSQEFSNNYAEFNKALASELDIPQGTRDRIWTTAKLAYGPETINPQVCAQEAAAANAYFHPDKSPF